MAGSSQLAFLLTVSLQFLVTSVFGQGNNTTEPTSVSPPYRLSSSELAAAIAVPSVFCALLLIGLLIFMGLKIREKRQTEGTYRPSSEEQVGYSAQSNPTVTKNV
ncbi:protein crumbs homolog 3 isoform X2 [Eublepharis macularius]|uniref:Protein crumbs homolog 3 isoform X2 n=1 Tax=Eublepharis macularius TaxID=481883 RepID=A0AA97KN06_EUBMA|nr:protein crumbs homolog 3 isoform X2 [Eublepharis macularius]